MTIELWPKYLPCRHPAIQSTVAVKLCVEGVALLPCRHPAIHSITVELCFEGVELLPCRHPAIHSSCRTVCRELCSYLVDIQPSTVTVELSVEGVEHADDLQGFGSGTDGRETHQITEQHCDIINLPGSHTLTCNNHHIKYVPVWTQCVLTSLFNHK